MTEYGFEIASHLAHASQRDVWDRIATWEGVNHELAPLVRMTHPARYPTVEDVPADGKSHFTSYFLALGVLPIDAHRFALRGVEVPAFFDEVSSNALLRVWAHRRSVTAVEGGVEVRDVCSLVPRFAPLGRVLERVYRFIFVRRHARLRAYYAQG